MISFWRIIFTDTQNTWGKKNYFSTIQGIAEIYKIHGSLEVPDSIVINEQDYLQFQENSSYLAAKADDYFYGIPDHFSGIFHQ